MRCPRLSEAQREILIMLHLGWHWGADRRSVRGLRLRGLVHLLPHTINHGSHVARFDLPHLTEAGRPLAARLWLETPAEQKQAVRAVFLQWGLAS